MLELRLRHWLKDILGDDHLQWIEPARGSSVGVGDAEIMLPRNGKLPVELKVWSQTRLGLRCDMRPAQIRYHYMTWFREKSNTAIIYAVERNVFVVAGKYVPKDKYNHFVLEKGILIGDINDKEIQKANLFRAIMRAFNK